RYSGTLGGVDPAGADAVSGQAQLVVGSPGTDTLTGGGLNDTLAGARGQMAMTGGARADVFLFGAGPTNATITDFTPGVDKLEFDQAGKLDHRNFSIRQEQGNTVVTVGNDHVVLLGVNSQQLTAHHDYGGLLL